MTALTQPVRRRHRARWKTVLGIALTAAMLFPVYWMVNVSLTRTEDMRSDPPHWFPWNPTLEGYANVLDDQLPAMTTSLGIGVGCVALTLLVSAPAAFALAKLRPWGAGPLTFVLLVVQMIPGVVMAIGFYAVYVRLGWLNTVWGLILADSTIAVPFGVLVLTAFMTGVPGELLQAARIDGAGRWRTFVSVVLPLSRNALLTVSLFTFLWAWSDFIFASTLSRNADAVPVTLGIYAYIGNNTTQWNSIMATAVVASVPAAVLLVVAQRYVAGGVVAGAVKD
ncbi:carbohydrate ABC transporter permease [Streptomyces aidingensis]|uniref:Multiple sugar transport system permease protein n=1 Tax=Streptomyces aidingensis TaxID=910347 RepID=A0A1I1TAN6_9ACTN|nr:carbohydrate ABC transporter permease [Streptomyces aidingensis]SFD52500.1 multiple sugar transport system permease protein [Streptomyces aidingensis]